MLSSKYYMRNYVVWHGRALFSHASCIPPTRIDCGLGHTGYHWALVLSPKDHPNSEQDASHIPDSDRWHLSNQARTVDGRRQKALIPWYLDCDRVSMFASVSLIARFVLGKFKTSDHETTMQRISAAIATVPIDHSDPTLSCRTWLMRVVDVLITEQIIELSVANASALEARAIYEADEVMKKIMAQKIQITTKSTIPVIDMRAHQD
ncbi:hypothetical protein EVG20_g8323 [Dentipellis fragilis]|uniref:Uncharacterized protein n=1 Tax=Dentipellis fragilis TaxID=205917 RepID=A0A4Y9Y884_9AGAM|nr:hypothetical protein EVG20_g8323 [Dentipellis fragilis]